MKLKKFIFASSVATTLLLPATAVFATTQSVTISDLSSADSWATKSISDVVKIGWMSGDPSGNFHPKDLITRREVAVVLTKILHLSTPDVKFLSYADVSSNDWGLKYIEAVHKAGVMNGEGSYFRPKNFVTREELAVILAKVADLKTTDLTDAALPFNDSNSISDWAKSSIMAVVNAGLMSGNGLNFNPKSQATREEFAVVLDKLAYRTGNPDLYLGTWSTTLANKNLYLTIDHQGTDVNVSLYSGSPNTTKPYFTIPVKFVDGIANFDTDSYAGTIQLNQDAINFNLSIKTTTNVTIFGSKSLNCVFNQQ